MNPVELALHILKKEKIVSKCVLVVDDDPVNSAMVAEVLVSAGYAVIARSDSRRILEYHEAIGFDVIVTDVLMPDLDGLELIMKRRDAGNTVRIVAMSAGSGAYDPLPAARTFGANATLHKPIRVAELLAAVEGQPGTAGSASPAS
jgi:CheY-like chemotaxis protein